MDECALCRAFSQDFRIIEKNELAFCIVCKWPLKRGHVMVLPKRHVEGLDELDEKESKQLLEMIEDMKRTLNDIFEEDCVVFQNSGSHSTQGHLHFHLLPSKGELREFFSALEGIPERPDVSHEEMEKMRDEILENYKKGNCGEIG